jgi:hypothetical protein
MLVEVEEVLDMHHLQDLVELQDLEVVVQEVVVE